MSIGAYVAVVAVLFSGCVSPIVKQAGIGDKDQVGRLIAAGSAVDGVSDGVTPLIAAAAEGRIAVINLLIAKGANPNFRPAGGWSPLFAAVHYKHVNTVKLLVRSGAEVTPDVVEEARLSSPEIYLFISETLGARALTQERLQKAVSAAVSPQALIRRETPSSDVDSPSYSQAERPDDYAIVVGIEKYADPDLPQAIFAEHDAEAVRAHFVALGVPARQIKMLSGSRATKSQLTAYLEQWLPANVKNDSRVFFYFSGHGAPAADSREAYLLPFDGDPEYLSDTGYPLKRLYAKLNGLGAERILVALDSCFSGAGGRSVVAPGTRPLATKTEPWLLGKGHVTAISASKNDQVSGTIDGKGHGIFTYFFLKGLNGAAASENRVTVQGLFRYIQPKVGDEASMQNRSQTPQLLPDAAEDFRLR